MATKSPLAAPSPRIGAERVNGSASYFPQQQQQQQQQQQHYHGGVADAETLSNTLANSHIAPPDSTALNTNNNPINLVAPVATRPNGRFTEEWDASQRGSSIVDGASPGGQQLQRANSFSGSAAAMGGVIGEGAATLSRGNTLKKKASLRRAGSLKRSSSRRSMKAGSVRSLALQSTTDQDEIQSAFYCPVPTAGSPTEVLANRFQAWRKILKDLITYFREVQNYYEHRAKSLLKLSNVLNNTATPPGFLASGGLDDALQILRAHNKQSIAEATKAREIEEDVILALTGLRSDLHQKIKEIKNLSGDFKNSVEKEMETTRRAVNHLQEVLGQTELDSALTTGKQDPYLLRLAVDRQLEKQIDEENYLHQAYLNLENSGRELESIVVGEIQKSYNALAGILKRESDVAYGAIEELRIGPIAMPKDTEWSSFVHRDDRFVDPDVPMRSAQFIHYPGREHYACQEIRAGLLERKSKYLKSYTAGWYVLSPTHLHEFKSADKTQAPVMSLYLPEQKLGSHSTEGGSSNKFILKGRQTGSMHRGHTWVFRAESHDTMMAWYDDIRTLTERTPEERSNFVRGHVRSLSRASQRSSVSSDGMGDDDEEPPFATTAGAVSSQQQPRQDPLSRRPSGGRFPSDLQVNTQRGLQVPSPHSVSSGYADVDNHFEDSAGNTIHRNAPQSGLQQQNGGYDGSQSRTHFETGSTFYPQPGHRDAFDIDAADRAISPASDNFAAEKSGTATPANMYRGPDHSMGHDAAAGLSLDARGFLDGNHASNSRSQSSSTNDDGRGRALVQDAKPVSNWDEKRMRGRGTPDGFPGTSDEMNGGYVGEQRPRMTARNDSAPTISNLHIPGEYPKGTPSY
ncbi:hypothetical protein B0T16DRAFT_456274 [Cercophora newfieldiana]|uniref:PH domain-containing protein n=1 Tax=Cercophora newfieldiana TaxID=92897 RepID=A0AA39YC34_9PEZI|nr:hypothetical protein B0T16DRAFT_456274 [Cercophora newfieldiana]